MALTGELSDLSLAELIEFFCNQRKTGNLKVDYPVGAGYFYLKAGAVIHARFGDLRGIDAVYYALTQANASFTFSPELDEPEHTINQPWTSVVLEGLRRMDEGIAPPQPSPTSLVEAPAVAQQADDDPSPSVKPIIQADKPEIKLEEATQDVKAFGVLLSSTENNSFTRRRWSPAMVVTAVVLLIAVIGVPWAVYTRRKAARFVNEASAAPVTAPTPTADSLPSENQPELLTPPAQDSTSADAAEIARRQREARARERAKASEQSASSTVDGAAKPTAALNSTSLPQATSNKRATVHVTYDENGRVTAASGGDATALRIARQKRFPPGKPGSATITIPIN